MSNKPEFLLQPALSIREPFSTQTLQLSDYCNTDEPTVAERAQTGQLRCLSLTLLCVVYHGQCM